MRFELFIPDATPKTYYTSDSKEMESLLLHYLWLEVRTERGNKEVIRTDAVTHFREEGDRE